LQPDPFGTWHRCGGGAASERNIRGVLRQGGTVRAVDDDGFATIDCELIGLECDTNASSSFVKARKWSSLRYCMSP